VPAILVLLLSFSAVEAGLSGHYKTLGLAPTASEEDVRNAYKKLAKIYHPDRNKDPSAQEKFLRVSEAHEVLSDPAKRRQAALQDEGGYSRGFYSSGGARYRANDASFSHGRQQYYHYNAGHDARYQANFKNFKEYNAYRQQQQQQYQQRFESMPLYAQFLAMLVGNLPLAGFISFAVYYFVQYLTNPEAMRAAREERRQRREQGQQHQQNRTQDRPNGAHVSVSAWHLREIDLDRPSKPFIVVVLTQKPMVDGQGLAAPVARWVADLNAKYRADKVMFRALSRPVLGETGYKAWKDFLCSQIPWADGHSSTDIKNDVDAVFALRPSHKSLARLRAPLSTDSAAILVSFVERLLDGQAEFTKLSQDALRPTLPK